MSDLSPFGLFLFPLLIIDMSFASCQNSSLPPSCLLNIYPSNQHYLCIREDTAEHELKIGSSG